ncbi:hypothetical protein L5014_19410 [Paraburkholderia sp. RG36]|uniref:Uncharacterized protein n=1 Tax=Paraburkholderia tagetis TaxID=2913261 RepID=A0A9X1RNE0_9BURK|nr:hypothetical protein [Paraburkholderia tagetis]
MNQRVLAVGIDHEYTLSLFVECCAEMHRDRALADPALLLRDCDYLCCQLGFSFLLIVLDFTWIKLRFNGIGVIFIALDDALAVWPRFMRIKAEWMRDN